MDSPFVYTREVTGDLFVGRIEDVEWLSGNLLKGMHSILISPPKYGKTSLINQAIAYAQKQHPLIRVCSINLFNIRSEIEFVEKLARETLKYCCTTVEEWKQTCLQYFEKTAPVLEINQRYQTVKVNFDSNLLLKHVNETFDFLDTYVEKVEFKQVLCIENIQNIEELSFDLRRLFLKHVRKHNNLTYVLAGNKKNALQDLFNEHNRKSVFDGDVIILEPYDEKIFGDFIVRAFSKSGRVIKKEQAEQLVRNAKGHPYYIQLYAHLIWCSTKGFVTDQVFDNAENQVLEYCHSAFVDKVESLSHSQINYLKAIIDEVDRFCSIETIEKYQFNSSANVTRVRLALIKKEILEFNKTKPFFIDPLFEVWFKKIYMEY